MLLKVRQYTIFGVFFACSSVKGDNGLIVGVSFWVCTVVVVADFTGISKVFAKEHADSASFEVANAKSFSIFHLRNTWASKIDIFLNGFYGVYNHLHGKGVF